LERAEQHHRLGESHRKKPTLLWGLAGGIEIGIAGFYDESYWIAEESILSDDFVCGMSDAAEHTK
jgi:hypothetical protein